MPKAKHVYNIVAAAAKQQKRGQTFTLSLRSLRSFGNLSLEDLTPGYALGRLGIADKDHFAQSEPRSKSRLCARPPMTPAQAHGHTHLNVILYTSHLAILAMLISTVHLGQLG